MSVPVVNNLTCVTICNYHEEKQKRKEIWPNFCVTMGNDLHVLYIKKFVAVGDLFCSCDRFQVIKTHCQEK